MGRPRQFSMMWRSLILSALVVILLALPDAYAKQTSPRKQSAATTGPIERQTGRTTVSGPVEIVARQLEYDREKDTYIAKGNVEVHEGARHLTADSVLFNDATKDAYAEGNVVFQDEEDVIYADKISLNFETKLGTIERGRIFIKKGNFYVTGEEIEKTGESTYEVKRGEFTTCGFDERVPWKFTARDVDITLQGYAKARHATFRILGKPVLYLPWGIFPVKTERESGLLLPEFTLSSRDGAILSNSYFWAISKDKDATFDVDLIQKRGVKPGMEFRYFLREDLKGTWYTSFIDDSRYDHFRYQIKGEHEQMLNDMALLWDV